VSEPTVVAPERYGTLSSRGLDPIKFEVVRNALVAATEEMSITLRRSAYSTNIKTRADFSCALFDPALRCVAQSFSQPVHLGAMAMLVKSALECYGTASLGPGDAIVTNDPYLPGSHLNDITVITPVHSEGMLLGYVANLAHHVDVGGGAPASVGAFREIYQEGILIPPVKLAEGGEVIPDIFALVLAQVRTKYETAGDLRAQLAANAAGALRLAALVDRYGSELTFDYIAELLYYTELRTNEAIKQLPRGVYEAEGFLDWDGFTDVPVRLCARIAIGDTVVFDLAGCDAQRSAPVNSTLAHTVSACAYVLKCLIDGDIAVNDGFYRAVHVEAPAGTVVHCVPPAPVVGTGETQLRLTDVLFKALAPALPAQVPAGTKGMICHAGFGGVDPRSGEYYCFLETLAGGYGARQSSDGPDAVQAHGQNTENAPVEETERSYPVRILRYELVENSEGPGQFRGGLGLRRDYLFADHAATFTILADRDREGPWGLFGGLPGQKAEYVLNPGPGEVRLRSKVTLELSAGDVISYRTCGGGGYGPPLTREPALVVADVREGKVSRQRARDVYRVEIDDLGQLDPEVTDALRSGQ
jgi:N-methylhydantoinase B